jgi:hypothetical protein
MPNSTSETSIIDRALQLLGYSQIASSQQVGNRGAKSMKRAYTPVKLAELQKNYWHFSIVRALLPASLTPPVHTKRNAYPLPGDFIMLAPEDQYGSYPTANDWIVEGGQIISDDNGPLPIRYVSSNVLESQFDALFAEGLSAALAIACGEELTNSQSKIDRATALYIEQIQEAKKRGSILTQKARLPVSSWISARG